MILSTKKNIFTIIKLRKINSRFEKLISRRKVGWLTGSIRFPSPTSHHCKHASAIFIMSILSVNLSYCVSSGAAVQWRGVLLRSSSALPSLEGVGQCLISDNHTKIYISHTVHLIFIVYISSTHREGTNKDFFSSNITNNIFNTYLQYIELLVKITWRLFKYLTNNIKN